MKLIRIFLAVAVIVSSFCLGLYFRPSDLDPMGGLLAGMGTARLITEAQALAIKQTATITTLRLLAGQPL